MADLKSGLHILYDVQHGIVFIGPQLIAIWKESVNSDSQPFYQQYEQSAVIEYMHTNISLEFQVMVLHSHWSMAGFNRLLGSHLSFLDNWSSTAMQM
jgi:hypothetical protein